MESRSHWPAAAAAAALLACLPAKTLAERPPIRPQDPPDVSVVFDDSDPWRPDNGGPTGTVQGGPAVAAPDVAGPAHVQHASRNVSFVEWLLRALRFLFLGSEPR